MTHLLTESGFALTEDGAVIIGEGCSSSCCAETPPCCETESSVQLMYFENGMVPVIISVTSFEFHGVYTNVLCPPDTLDAVGSGGTVVMPASTFVGDCYADEFFPYEEFEVDLEFLFHGQIGSDPCGPFVTNDTDYLGVGARIVRDEDGCVVGIVLDPAYNSGNYVPCDPADELPIVPYADMGSAEVNVTSSSEGPSGDCDSSLTVAFSWSGYRRCQFEGCSA